MLPIKILNNFRDGIIYTLVSPSGNVIRVYRTEGHAKCALTFLRRNVYRRAYWNEVRISKITIPVQG